ncbi:hypothetical protein BDQ17DRAFT_1440356 [Cyathus striatus]|nr:hypothetical protein BDQ17DRAFT_1440356 [Cyathus striatus]
MLCCMLLVSNDPCSLSLKGSTLLVKVQRVLDAALPGHGYRVKLTNCSISHQNPRDAVLHWNKRFGSCQDFFRATGIHGNPDAIRKYVNWALRTNGPAFFKVPVDRKFADDPDDPTYQYGHGPFQSPFIIET